MEGKRVGKPLTQPIKRVHSITRIRRPSRKAIFKLNKESNHRRRSARHTCFASREGDGGGRGSGNGALIFSIAALLISVLGVGEMDVSHFSQHHGETFKKVGNMTLFWIFLLEK